MIEQPRRKAPWNKMPVITERPCLHKQCTKCHGTGRTKTGELCVHSISCPCPRCNLRFK